MIKIKQLFFTFSLSSSQKHDSYPIKISESVRNVQLITLWEIKQRKN